MKKKIGIDLDGTVANFILGASQVIKENFGHEPDLSKGFWGMDEIFNLVPGTFHRDMKDFIYKEKRLFRNLAKLEEDNHLLTSALYEAIPDLHVYIVTARPTCVEVVEDTRLWIKENEFLCHGIHHADDKASLCVEKGISVMIEDQVNHITELSDRGVDVIVMDQPWNRDLDQELHEQKARIRRVNNWREAFVAAKELL